MEYNDGDDNAGALILARRIGSPEELFSYGRIIAVVTSAAETTVVYANPEISLVSAETDGAYGLAILNAARGKAQIVSEMELTNLLPIGGSTPKSLPVISGKSVIFELDGPISEYILFPEQYRYTPERVVKLWERELNGKN